MKLTLMLVSVAVIASGCSTYAATRYSISADDVVALRGASGKAINVGKFTATKPGQSEIPCRAVGPIKTPDGEPFSEYIREALIDEMQMANVFSATAPVVITGNLDAIDFDSAVGTWSLALTIKSSNGKSMKVSEVYSYTTSYYGETACNQTAQALMPAVQNLIGKVVRAPEFTDLISQ